MAAHGPNQLFDSRDGSAFLRKRARRRNLYVMGTKGPDCFWSLLVVALGSTTGWPLDKLTSRITYTDTLFNALALGVVNSLDRTLAAVLGGVLVTLVIRGRKSEFWALIVAVLYLLNAPRPGWVSPATGWDRLWQSVSMVFPAVACIVAAFITASIRRGKSKPEHVAEPSVAG